MNFYNQITQKQSILLNLAGTELQSPILAGLPIKIELRFQKTFHSVSFSVNGTTVSLPQVEDELFSTTLIAGNSPTINGKNVLKFALTNLSTGEQTLIERQLFIQPEPTDILQVFNISSNQFVNGSLTAQLVSQQCGVRFFVSWLDEFRIKRFGGVKYLSVFDTGFDENSSLEEEVFTINQQEIDRVKYIYLIKHLIDTQESHDVTFRFRTGLDSTNFLDKRVLLNTPSCFGFVVNDPQTTS